ncbi:TonB-dependent receptor domain-containing protein [Delftia sp. RIT313]|uniref:TonB-dependent receptor domain-containing protein n=1 Tax=Delftia sp. RIT313 TaxID=1468410 RepID=UPI0004486A5C|nr:TonB-dependent receptor [Delftia sp. RIT313]EZP54398.1 TonB-dependent vitamin B12 receptor [Delftia sp. RIT313]
MHTLALARAPGAALRSPSAFPVLRTLSALAAASLLACQAQAQVQQAQQAQRAQTSQLDTVVVTASRSEQSLRTVTADMTVIDAETIARSGATGVADLLVQVPGVQINRNGGPGQVTSVYLRGTSNQHTAVFIDGVRYSSQELQGGAVWSTLPLAQIERIEVLRGPAAAIYGSDAMGGVIQIFTKRADGQTRAYAEAGIGNQGTSKLATGFQGGANGFTYGLNLADERSDGFDVYPGNTFSPNPDKDGYSNTSLGLNAGYKTGIHQIDASLLHSRLRTHYDQSPPPFDDYDVVKNTTGSLRWQAGWNAMYKSVVQVSHTDSQSDRHTQSSESAKGRSTNYLLQNLFTLGQHRFNIDLERREDRLDTQYAWTQNTDSRRVQNSLSAGWRLTEGRHQFDANLRHDQVRDQQNKTTGGLGYGLQIDERWRWVASAGTAFRTPTLYERFTGQAAADLKPESSTNVETGLHYAAGANRLSTVVYRNKFKNLITYDWNSALPCNCYRNWQSAEITGLTLSGSTRLGSANLGASLDFMNPENLETGKLLPYRSKRMLKLNADTQAAGWTLGGEAQLYSGRYADEANTLQLGGYGVVNLYAQRQLTRQWTLLARVNNIADRDYAPTRGYANAGRTVFVSVRWTPLP